MRKKIKTSELSVVKDSIFSAFEQIEKKIDVRTKKSIALILVLFLSIKGRINFLQLERFSGKCESGFRTIFEKEFDFKRFNISLIQENIPGRKALAFDPSYISKSGKTTPGVGYFWSGCEGKTKWGLELCGLAVLDLERKTAFHLDAFQTIDNKEDESLLEFYARNLLENKEQLLEVSKTIAVDAYFSKNPFVNQLVKEGFEVISKFRDDADLKYLFSGEQKKGRGRPRIFGGKIDIKNLDLQYAKLVSNQEKEQIYSLIAYSKSLEMKVNTVIVYTKNSKNKWCHKIYFSTDLEKKWNEILEIYQQRFQIEFLYRDAKQFTGLNDCEARSKNKIKFHWNASLTAVNVAKIEHWLPLKDKHPNSDIVFSMSDIKTQYFNELLLKRFISMFGINPKLEKNKQKIKQLLDFGKIAA